MQAIADIQFTFPTETARSQRGAILNDLHEIYTEYAQSFPTKNKKRYYAYLGLHHPRVLKEARTKEEYDKFKPVFKKAKLTEAFRHLEYIKKSDFRYWGRFSHLKEEEGNESLRFMVSRARDILNRNGNVAAYVFGAVLDNPESVDKPLA